MKGIIEEDYRRDLKFMKES